MSYEHSTKAWGAKQLASMVKNGRIVFNNIIQRSYVWETKRKSLLIHSMATNVPIPSTYAKRADKGSGKKDDYLYDMLDGKQRISTISDFINGNLRLSDLPLVTFYNELTDKEETEDISHKTFEQISEGLQEKIKNVRINVIFFDNLTKEEERELFRRLNNGKPLSTKSKAVAACLDIENLLDIGEHNLFKEMLTSKALDNKNHISIIMKIWCMINQDISQISFENKYFNRLIENTETSKEERLEMIQVFDYIVNTHAVLAERNEKKVAKKLYTETHLVSLVPYFVRAINDGIDEEHIADWLIEFFKTIDGNTSISEEYNNAASKSSAKSVNIQIRNSSLSESFNEFFKIDGEGSGTLIPNDEDIVSEVNDNDNSEGQEQKEELKGAQEQEHSEEQKSEENNFVDSIIEDMENVEDTDTDTIDNIEKDNIDEININADSEE